MKSNKLLDMLKLTLRGGLMFGLVAGLFITSPMIAQDDDEDLEELEEFTVTGSRIKRIDVETVSPVISMTSENLEETGFDTVGDALRSLPFNNGQALTPTDSGTSFTPGVSTMNLRGLGNNNTLVLINGRRAAPYAAPGFNGFQTVFDLNSLPSAAISSMEILKDGASAIYGSDAVAGVLNVKLREDYEGLNTRIYYGNYTKTDGAVKQASMVAGTASAKTSIIVAADWKSINSVFSRDLPWSKDADNTNAALKEKNWMYIAEDRDAAIADYGSWSNLVADEARFGDIDYWMTQYYGYDDNRSSRGYPGWFLTSAGVRTFVNPTNNPSGDVGGANESGSINYYNYNETNGMFPEYRSYSYYTRLSHQITDTLKFTGEFSFSRVNSVVYSAATPVDIESSQGLYVGAPMVNYYVIPYDYDGDGVVEFEADLMDADAQWAALAATWTGEGDAPLPGEENSPWPAGVAFAGMADAYINPYNPYEDVDYGRRRLIELPNRISDVTSDSPRAVIALEGQIDENWSYELGYLYSKNTVNNISRNAAPDYRLQQAFMGLTELADGSLTWNEATDPADRVYFNWFGANSDAFADFLAVENPNSASFELKAWDASITGTIMEMPHGPLALAAGVENRKEDFENIKSDLNATGMILGGSEGTSSAGRRSLDAIFMELNIPVIPQLEIQLAARYEEYSDPGFDKDIRPKIGVKVKPTEWLLLRASYSESFKAPDLAYMFTAGQTSFTSFQLNDPVTNNQIDQLMIKTTGNPGLAPETTDTLYAGIVLEPTTGFLKDFGLAVDWFQFKQSNLLAQLSDFFGYETFILNAADGDPLFADKVIRDSASGEILFIRDVYENISSGKYEGLDIVLSYKKDTENFGSFSSNLYVTKLLALEIDGSDIIGSYLTPKYRATLSETWSWGDWNVAVYGTYMDSRIRNFGTWDYTPSGVGVDFGYKVEKQILWNAAVSYSGLLDSNITFGVRNLTNSTPPLDNFDPSGTTPGLNSHEPRYYYMSVSRDF